jgi:hypothetical protein
MDAIPLIDLLTRVHTRPRQHAHFRLGLGFGRLARIRIACISGALVYRAATSAFRISRKQPFDLSVNKPRARLFHHSALACARSLIFVFED